jgi:hypothetical protein
MALADELQRAKAREEIAKLDAGERRLASELKLDISKRRLSVDELNCWNRFSAWCEGKSVRKLPAKPATVASYVIDAARMGVPPEEIFSVLEAISIAHDYHGLSSPVPTAATRAAIQQVGGTTSPPRSWSKEDAACWPLLPEEVQRTIYRHETERDVALKRKFNELADLRRRLMTDADKLGQTNEVKEIENVTTT